MIAWKSGNTTYRFKLDRLLTGFRNQPVKFAIILNISYRSQETGGLGETEEDGRLKKYQRKFNVNSRYRHIEVGLKASVPF